MRRAIHSVASSSSECRISRFVLVKYVAGVATVAYNFVAHHLPNPAACGQKMLACLPNDFTPETPVATRAAMEASAFTSGGHGVLRRWAVDSFFEKHGTHFLQPENVIGFHRVQHRPRHVGVFNSGNEPASGAANYNDEFGFGQISAPFPGR